MIKKKLLLLVIGCFALAIGLTTIERASHGCTIMTNHGEGNHNVFCPKESCTRIIDWGIPCSYCDGTGVETMPNGGGCNTAYYDLTFDCGSWYNGTCSFWGHCVDAEEGAPCLEHRGETAC